MYEVLVGKPEGKTPLGRPESKCKNEIKMGLKEIESVRFGLDLTGLGYRPAVSSRKQVNEILGTNFVTSQRLLVSRGYRAGWCDGNDLDLYSGVALFESRPCWLS
jgi:hypothetical protein